MLVPFIPFLVLYSPYWELPLSQTFVESCVPRLPTRWPLAAGFAEVGAKYPFHPLDRSRALGAIAFPIPPASAFLIETRGS